MYAIPVELLPISIMPPIGNNFKSTANNLIKNSPIKNDGNDIAAKTPIVTNLSNQECCFVAEITPIIRAIIQVKNKAATATINVFQMNLLSNEVTGS